MLTRARCSGICAARKIYSCKMDEPRGQLFGAAVAAQEHRSIRCHAADPRDSEIFDQPPRALQPRAHSGRRREQELVIFASTEGITQGGALRDRHRISVDDRADAAGLPYLPDTVGKAITEIDARTRGTVAAEHQAKTGARLRTAVSIDGRTGRRRISAQR